MSLMNLGWPAWLPPLATSIFWGFHGLPERADWKKTLIEAIPPGLPERVFNRIRDRFLPTLLEEKMLPLVPEKNMACREAIAGVVTLFQRSVDGTTVDDIEWLFAQTPALHVQNVAGGASIVALWAAAAKDSSITWADELVAKAVDEAASVVSNTHGTGDAVAAFWRWAAEWLLAIIREEVAAWEAAGKPA